MVILALAARMEAMAAYLAIDRCCAFRLGCGDALNPSADNLMCDLLDALDHFDAELQGCESSAACLAGSAAAAEWRQMLAAPHREIPPWWLDDQGSRW
jgi:hypothetical protein